MRHRVARRRLPELLDGALPGALAEAVREHAAGCARCERELAELALCERLVAALPLGAAPLSARAVDRRLHRLGRWAPPPPTSRGREGIEGLALIAAAAAFSGVVALAGVSRWLPAPGPDTSGLVQVAYVMPSSASR
jgi:anti-sigma factor RsiW